MPTLATIASTLRTQVDRLAITQETLAQDAGVSRQTLSKVLSGQSDFRVTTLLALADRLGLELVLLPKDVAGSMQGVDTPASNIKSGVQAALEKLNKQLEER